MMGIWDTVHNMPCICSPFCICNVIWSGDSAVTMPPRVWVDHKAAVVSCILVEKEQSECNSNGTTLQSPTDNSGFPIFCGFIRNLIGPVYFNSQYFRPFSRVTPQYFILILDPAACFLRFSTSRAPNHLKHGPLTTRRTRNQHSLWVIFRSDYMKWSPRDQDFRWKDEWKLLSGGLSLIWLHPEISQVQCDP